MALAAGSVGCHQFLSRHQSLPQEAASPMFMPAPRKQPVSNGWSHRGTNAETPALNGHVCVSQAPELPGGLGEASAPSVS